MHTALYEKCRKDDINMANKKKISLMLAFCLSVSVLAAGCGSNDDTSDSELTPNIITSADAEGGETTSVTTVETQVVTDENGEAATGVNGDVLTEPVGIETQVPSETLSEEEIEQMMTATYTEPTAIVKPSIESSTKYAYQSLDDDEKALYDAIVGAASSMRFKIRNTENVSIEKWSKVFGMVYNQEPQLFWLNTKAKVGKIYFNESDTAKIEAMQAEIDKTVDKLISEASGKSTYDQLKIFHDYLVLNSTFGHGEDVASYNSSIYNAFGHGSDTQGDIQCVGYAKAMQYLCDKVGIECMVITGTNDKDQSHAWNKVKVDGEWYNLDATWDDPILSTPITTYIRYNYFLVPDEWINEKTHFNINKKVLSSGESYSYFTPPAATATAQNYFIKNGLVYSDIDSAETALKKALDDAASSGLTVAEIMVDSQSVYDTMKSRLKDYQSYVKDKYSNVKGLADNCNDNMLLIELDVKYN